MSDFAAKFTNANIAQDAAPYDSSLFQALNEKISKIEPSTHKGFSIALLSAMLVAQKRGDAVSALFQDAIKDDSDADVKEIFICVREALALAAPFVGFPSCMPAVFGLVGQLRKRGIDEVQTQPRPGFEKFDYTTEGMTTFKKVYLGVGNSEVGEMLDHYFPEISYYANTAVFGYLISGNSLLTLQEKELVLASCIFAQGAIRQSQSHCKAAIQLGNRVEVVQALSDASVEVALWNKNPLPAVINVPQLEEEVKCNLAALTAETQ